jgi:carboxyl-terminal processing protease
LKIGRKVLLVGAIAGVVWLVTRLWAAGAPIFAQIQKISTVMALIQNSYVEEADLDRLTEGAIDGMLKRLDPHSIYIPVIEQREVSERDLGEFQGIGVSFVIESELITVVSPIVGSPSDRLGIRAGDQIIEIDGVSAVGINEDEVFKKLRGKKGTSVRLKILRDSVPQPLDFTVIRDDIPIHSVLTSFMLDDSTGYLLLSQFTATTSEELEKALRKLESAGMKRLIFDLRNNGGGRLNEAVATADMFLPGGYTIVSRAGRNAGDDSVYYSREEGTHPIWDLIVLINDGSASASEIIAAAVQDLDRGLVVGQRSFGKGLVQNSYPMKDGSVVRLSTAHWFAPSGRLVQIPYDKGRGEYYAVRYRDQGLEADSSQRVPYRTLGGRTVYGTMGIRPDSLVDDVKITGATANLIGDRTVFGYGSDLAREHKFKSQDDFLRFLTEFEVSNAELDKLMDLAKEKDKEYPREALDKDRHYLRTLLKAEIAQVVWNSRDAYYMVMTRGDKVVQTAVSLFSDARNTAERYHRDSRSRR